MAWQQWIPPARSWLHGRGLMPLAAATLLAVLAVALFTVAALFRQDCSADCRVWLTVPAAFLETLGFTTVLVALAAIGSWIGHLSHATSQERLRLRLAALDLDDDVVARERLQMLARDDVAAIGERGRISLWTAAPVALLSILMLPFAGSQFGASGFAAYLFPVLILSLTATLAASVRGISILVATRRIGRPN